jgi:hypothetical protein
MFKLSPCTGVLQTHDSRHTGHILASRSLLLFTTVAILGAIMFGCKPKSQSDLYGRYIADYDLAKEELTLNADGTFTQKVVLKATSKVDTSKGTWIFRQKEGYLVFDKNFMNVMNGFAELRPNYNRPNEGTTCLPVGRWFGRIMIGTSKYIVYTKCVPAPASSKDSAPEKRDATQQETK